MDGDGKGVIYGRKAEQQGVLYDEAGSTGLGGKAIDVRPSRKYYECFGFQKKKKTLKLSKKKERKIPFRDINDTEANFRSVGKVILKVSKIRKYK